MKYELTPRDELYSRISRLQKQLLNQGIRAALIQENTDLFYFAGTIQRSIMIVPASGEPVLAVSGNLQRAVEESRLRHIIPLSGMRQIDSLLTDFDLSISGNIGLDLDVLPASYYVSMLTEFKNAKFVNISDTIKRLRMIKSAWEIDRIRRACKMQEEIMRETHRIVRVGMTELDIDALLTAFARRRGHQGQFRSRGFNQAIHYAHILFGKNSAMSTYIKGPLGGSGTTPAYPIGSSFNVITQNGPLVIDFGIGLGGYISDMTRTFVIGKLPRDLEKAHAVSREIKSLMQEWVVPGKFPADLYREVITLVEKRGLSQNFMGFGENRVPFVGHGIGLELDEYPVIATNFNLPFQKGMVFAFEPKFAFPDKGAVGLEDDFAVTESGVDLLTTFDDNIQVIKK
jgi:Xaa-Pro aminopeptidase